MCCKPNQLKAPSAFSPFSRASDIRVIVPIHSSGIYWHLLCLLFVFHEWFPLSSNSRRAASILSTSVHSSASALSSPSMCTASGDCHTTHRDALTILSFVPVTTYSLISLLSLLRYLVLGAYGSHSLQDRTKPLRAAYTLTSVVRTKICHCNGACCLCG